MPSSGDFGGYVTRIPSSWYATVALPSFTSTTFTEAVALRRNRSSEAPERGRIVAGGIDWAATPRMLQPQRVQQHAAAKSPGTKKYTASRMGRREERR